jgi:hypothetical protein
LEVEVVTKGIRLRKVLGVFNSHPWILSRHHECQTCGVGRHWESPSNYDWRWIRATQKSPYDGGNKVMQKPTLAENVSDHEQRLRILEREVGLPEGGDKEVEKVVDEFIAEALEDSEPEHKAMSLAERAWHKQLGLVPRSELDIGKKRSYKIGDNATSDK